MNFIGDEPTLIDWWDEIKTIGKYALKSRPDRPIIIDSGADVFWMMYKTDLKYGQWGYPLTASMGWSRNWKSLEAAKKYIIKEMKDYWLEQP